MCNSPPLRILLLLTLMFLSCIVSAAQAQRPGQVDEANYFQGLEWRSIGPYRGGRVTAVAGHVADVIQDTDN